MVQRAVVAMMEHETNTFSPVPTPITRFGRHSEGVPRGEEVVELYAGTGTGIGAFIDVARSAGMELVTPIAGNAAPSGKVEREAYRVMTDAIVDAVNAGCDALFLDLHGAMVTQDHDDGEGTLLARVRQVAPDLPIAISLDLHANMTDDITNNCTVLVGYKTYPHMDMYEAGSHAGRLLLRSMAGEINPVMAWGSRPILAQTLRMGHDDRPMGPLIEQARQAESEGLLAASVFGGFPLADVPFAGVSVVTIADGDRARAEEVRDEILEAAWEERAEFVFGDEPLGESIARAAQLTAHSPSDGPVILLDHADNTASGGTQDTTAVLAEVMRQGLDDVAMFAIYDPAVVDEMFAAGEGSEITVSLGGKTDMPTIGRVGEPLEITGRVAALTDGTFEITVAMGRGTYANMGRSALLDTGKVQVVIISRHTEPNDLGHFRSFGVEPTEKRYLILKSRIHYRAGFAPIARHTIPCNGVGVTSSDNSLFRFENIRRPIYPLDADCPPEG
ncbi:MAG: M81 family metallopeptidase [Actinomycetia bacterium]|nr:M81 family metallopeptidase [Actinomycetes bacterium]